MANWEYFDENDNKINVQQSSSNWEYFDENDKPIQTTQQPVVNQQPVQNTPAQPQVVQQPPVQSQTVQNSDGSYTLKTGIQKKSALGKLKNIANFALNTAIPGLNVVRNWNTIYNKGIKPGYEATAKWLWHKGGQGLRAALPKKALVPFLSEDWWFGTDEQNARLKQLDEVARQTGYYDQNAVKNDFMKGKLSRMQANAYAQMVGERENLLQDLNYIKGARGGNTAEGIVTVGSAALPGGNFKTAGGIVGKLGFNALRNANASKNLALGGGKVARYLTQHALRGGQIGAEMAALRNTYENMAGIEHDPFAKELAENMLFAAGADIALPILFKGASAVGKQLGKGIETGANRWENTANQFVNGPYSTDLQRGIGQAMNSIGGAATNAGAAAKRFFTSDLNKVNVLGSRVNRKAKLDNALAELANEDAHLRNINPEIIRELAGISDEASQETINALLKGVDLDGNPLEPSEAYKSIMNIINEARIKKGLQPHEYSNGWKEPGAEPNIEPEATPESPYPFVNVEDTILLRKTGLIDNERFVEDLSEAGLDSEQILRIMEENGFTDKPITPETVTKTPTVQNPPTDINDTESLVGMMNELNSRKTNTGNPRYDGWIAKNKQKHAEGSGSPVKNETGINTHEQVQTPQNEPASHVSERRLTADEVLSEPLRESSTPKASELNRINNPEPQPKEQPEITKQDIYRANLKTKTIEKKAKKNYKFAREHVKYEGVEHQKMRDVEHLEPGMAEGANTPLDRYSSNRVEKGSQVKDSNGKGDYGDTYDVYSNELSPDEVSVSTKYKSDDVDFNKFYDNYSKNNFKNRAERLKAVKDEIERQGGDRKAFNDVYSKFMEQSEKDYNAGRPKKEGDLPYNDTWTESFMKDMKALSKRYKDVKPEYKVPDVGYTTKSEINYTDKLWRDNLGPNAKMLAGKLDPETKIFGLLNRKNLADAQKNYDIFAKSLIKSNVSGRYRDIMINQLDRAADKASLQNGYKIAKQNIKSISIKDVADDVLYNASISDHATAGRIISKNKKTLQYANKYYDNDIVAEHYSEAANMAESKIKNLTNKQKVISDAIDEAKRKLKGKWLEQRLEYIDKHKDEIFAEKVKEAEKIYEQYKNIIRNHYTDFEASERYGLVEKSVKGTTSRWKSEGTGDTWSTTTKNVSDKYKEANAVLKDLESRIQQAKQGFKKGTFKEKHFNTPEEGVQYKNWKPATKSESTPKKKFLSNEMQQGALHDEEIKLNRRKAELDKEYSKTYADYQKEFGKKAYSKWIKRRQEIRNESKQIEDRLEEISKERKEIQQKINETKPDGGVEEENIKEVIQNKQDSQIAEQPKNITNVKYIEITNSKGQKVGVHDSGNLDIYYPNGFIKKRVNIKENPNAKRYLEDKQTDIFSDDFDASKTKFGKSDRSVGSSHKFTDYAEEISNGDSEITKAIKETLGDEGFSFEEMSGGGRNYADGRVTINSKNPVVSQLKSLMHETHHKIAKAIAEMCGKDSAEYKIFQKGEEINNKIHDFESTNPGIVNTYNKIKSLRANDDFDGVREVYKDLSNTAKKYLADYEDMIDEYYGSIIETEANLAKTGKWQFFGKDLKHYAQRLKEFNNRRLKGNKSQIEGNNNRATTGRHRTDGSMEDKGQLPGRLGNTSDRQFLEDKGVGLKFLREQTENTYKETARDFDVKKGTTDKNYLNKYINDIKTKANDAENASRKRHLATDEQILGRLEMTGADTYLAPTQKKLAEEKATFTLKDIKNVFEETLTGESSASRTDKVKEVFGHKQSHAERVRSLQQQYVNTELRKAKVLGVDKVLNEVESMPETIPVKDGKILPGNVGIKQGIMANTLATGRGKDFYKLLDEGNPDKIMQAFVKPEHLEIDKVASENLRTKFPDLFDSKGNFRINAKLDPEIMLKKTPEAKQAYRAARHFIEIANMEKDYTYQVPKHIYDTLCGLDNEKVVSAFKHYGLTKGTVAKAFGTLVDVPTNIFKRAVLALSTNWNIGNRINNPVLMYAHEKSFGSLLKHYTDAFKLKQKDLPPELFDNNLFEASKLRDTLDNITGDHKVDAWLGLLSGNTVSKGYINNGIGKVLKATTLPRRILFKIGDANMKLNEMFENFERKVSYTKQLDDLADRNFCKNVGGNIIKQTMTLSERNSAVLKNPQIRKFVVDRVQDTLGDFSMMTPIEKNICKRVFPFYAWLRTINRSIYKLASDNPTKALMMLKTIYDIREDDIYRKEWQKGSIDIDHVIDTYHLPIKHQKLTRDGSKVVINPMKYLNYFDTHEDMTGRPGAGLSPYIINPYESITGKSSFTGRTLNSKRYVSVKMGKKYALFDTKTNKFLKDKDGNLTDKLPGKARLAKLGVSTVRLNIPEMNSSLVDIEKALSIGLNKKSKDTWKSQAGNAIEFDKKYDDSFGGFSHDDLGGYYHDNKGKFRTVKRFASSKYNKKGQSWRHFTSLIQEELPLNKEEKIIADYKKRERDKRIAAWKTRNNKKK